MDLERSIELITSWLDVIHIESAQARIDEKHAEHRAAEAPHTPAATSSADLFRTALHEAAHAVLAHGSDLGVTRAVVLASGRGSVAYSKDPKDHPLAAVMVHLAGPA